MSRVVGGHVRPICRVRPEHLPVFLANLWRGLQVLQVHVAQVLHHFQAVKEDVHLPSAERTDRKATEKGPQAEGRAPGSAAEHFVRQAAETPHNLGRVAPALDDGVYLVHRVEGAFHPKPTVHRLDCLSGLEDCRLVRGSAGPAEPRTIICSFGFGQVSLLFSMDGLSHRVQLQRLLMDVERRREISTGHFVSL